MAFSNLKFRSSLRRGAGEVARRLRRLAGRIHPGGHAGTPPGPSDLELLALKAADIDALVQLLEGRFLDVGKALERHSARTGELVSQSEVLLQLVTGQVGGEEMIRTGMDTLGRCLEFIERCHVQTVGLLGRLRGHQRQIEAMRRHEMLLGGALAPLKYVQTLFRIESATLPADVQSTFLGLTRDIEELFGRFGQVFGEQYQNLARSRDSISGLVSRIEQQAARQQAIAVEKRAQMRRTLDDLMMEMEESLKRDVTLLSVSRRIDSGVGTVIVALQCQDIVRQKLEHVRTASAEMAARSGPMSASSRRFVREAARIQLQQVEAVVSDLASAETGARGALEGLRTLAAELDRESVNLSEFKSVSSSESGMVQVLLTALDELRTMLATIVSIQEETHRTLKPLGGMASNVTGVMRNLSGHIKLIALNAQIQAAQVGKGTGLEVLSENTTRISDEIYRLNEEASTDLDLLIGGLSDAIRESAGLEEEARRTQQSLETEGRDMEQRLHAYRDATLDAFMKVGQTNSEFMAEAADTERSLDFSGPAAAGLAGILGVLGRLASQEVEAAVDPGDVAELEAGLRALRRNYTMESERVAHLAAGGVSDGVAPPDVDLFETPAGAESPANPRPPAGAVVPAGAGSVELF
jgi:hypothetical protein